MVLCGLVRADGVGEISVRDIISSGIYSVEKFPHGSTEEDKSHCDYDVLLHRLIACIRIHGSLLLLANSDKQTPEVGLFRQIVSPIGVISLAQLYCG